jgi:hypothetical protein
MLRSARTRRARLPAPQADTVRSSRRHAPQAARVSPPLTPPTRMRVCSRTYRPPRPTGAPVRMPEVPRPRSSRHRRPPAPLPAAGQASPRPPHTHTRTHVYVHMHANRRDCREVRMKRQVWSRRSSASTTRKLSSSCRPSRRPPRSRVLPSEAAPGGALKTTRRELASSDSESSSPLSFSSRPSDSLFVRAASPVQGDSEPATWPRTK